MKHIKTKYKKFTEHNEKRWMWRMSDILPVCLQDFLYSRKSELRKHKIRIRQAP